MPSEIIFFLFAIGMTIGIIILVGYLERTRERNLTMEFKKILSQRFPNSQIKIFSYGGFFSDPHVMLKDLSSSLYSRIDAKVVTVRHGKHSEQDLLVTTSLRDVGVFSGRSLTLQREGFFSRIFGGKEIKVGNEVIDHKLQIFGDPPFAKTFLLDDPSPIGYILADFRDLEKFDLREGQISIRTEHANSKSLKKALNILEKINEQFRPAHALEKTRDSIQELSVGRFEGEEIEEPIITLDVEEKTFQVPLRQEKEFGINKDILDAFEEFRFEAESLEYLRGGKVEIKLFVGAIKQIRWDINPQNTKLEAIGERISKTDLDFRLTSLGGGEFDFFDPFKNIKIQTDNTKLKESIEKRTEIASALQRFVGSSTINANVKSGKFSIEMGFLTNPKNIILSFNLVKDLAWFLDVSLM